MHLLQVSWWLHVKDGLDLEEVGFDSLGRYEVPEYLASRDPEEAFIQVQLDLVAVEVVEHLSKIIDERGSVPSLDDVVVDVDLDVPADLLPEAGLHAPMVGCACILQTEGDDVVAEDTVQCDECGQLLIFLLQLHLVVAGVSFEQGQALAARRGVDDLVDVRQREVVLWAVLIKASEVDAHAEDRHVFLRHHNWVGYAIIVLEFSDEAGLAEYY
jgi:hypothetical protein